MSYYVDYTYYHSTYHGELDETAFNSVIIKAQAKVDFFTNYRIIEINDSIKNATCALCDLFYKKEHSSIVSSESVGNHSRSYAVTAKTDADWNKEAYEIVTEYLGNTGLMYRGLKCILTQ